MNRRNVGTKNLNNYDGGGYAKAKHATPAKAAQEHPQLDAHPVPQADPGQRQLPAKEVKTMRPVTYGCEKCDAKYDMGDETTVYIYLKQPWFNHIVTVCPGCDTTYRVWSITEATIRYMEQNNMSDGDEVHWALEDFAPSTVQRLFARDEDKPLIVPIQRSARRLAHDESEVAFFAYLLNQGEQSW